MYHKEFDNIIIGAGPAGMRACAIARERGRERVRGRTQRGRWHMPQSRLHTHKGSCPVGIGDICCRISLRLRCRDSGRDTSRLFRSIRP